MKTAIIGAGPAGLAAAVALGRKNEEVIVIDKGKLHTDRKHDSATDLGIGIGGAGLFSDGKFSFYPSGTGVYQLNNKSELKEGHEWICEELSKVGIDSYPLKMDQRNSPGPINFFIKDYPSTYGNLEQRKKLIENLVLESKANFITESELIKINKDNNQYLITLKNANHEKVIKVDNIIIATGRLGNLDLNNILEGIPFEKNKLRFEFGIRVETKADIGFLNRKQNPDVKAIWKTPFGELRTFCTCRNGEVWDIPYGKLSAISGRSDGPKTNYSNFGLLLRFTGDSFEKGESLFNRIIETDLIKNGQVVWEPLQEFVSGTKVDVSFEERPSYPKEKFVKDSIRNIVGDDAYKVFKYAINKLIEWSPDLDNGNTRILFPVIEGTGNYPKITSDLQLENENIWCCGDLAGKFRGIIPAFLSGYYAAQNILKLREDYVCDNLISFNDNKDRKMIKKGVGVILYNEGKVLLGHRISDHGFDTWSFPGGKVEGNETVSDCAVRETYEETGIKLSEEEIILGPKTDDYFKESDQHYETQFVLANCNTNPQLTEPDKFRKWEWFEWDSLPSPLFKPIENLLSTRFQEEDIKESLNLKTTKSHNLFM